MLYRLLGVHSVHAQVISRGALQVLENSGIAVSWDTQVEFIRNRAGDGRCPMEQATEGITDPREALVAIENKLKELLS